MKSKLLYCLLLLAGYCSYSTGCKKESSPPPPDPEFFLKCKINGQWSTFDTFAFAHVSADYLPEIRWYLSGYNGTSAAPVYFYSDSVQKTLSDFLVVTLDFTPAPATGHLAHGPLNGTSWSDMLLYHYPDSVKGRYSILYQASDPRYLPTDQPTVSSVDITQLDGSTITGTFTGRLFSDSSIFLLTEGSFHLAIK